MNIFWAGHNWTIIKVDTNRQKKNGQKWTLLDKRRNDNKMDTNGQKLTKTEKIGHNQRSVPKAPGTIFWANLDLFIDN